MSAPSKLIGRNPDAYAALRRKYEVERNKRLRSDGKAQYMHLAEQFSSFHIDPYVAPGFVRQPISTDREVVIVGGGLSGLILGARLKQAAVDDVCIVEKAGDFGGTWYWNRFPGAACDTESYIYLPLLEELGYIPTEKYAKRDEIFSHCQAIGRHYRLYDEALFQTRVTDARWDEAIARWVIKTDRNDEIRARFLCMGTGSMSLPKVPRIPGIGDFKGHSFHTSRWDHDYTGGNSQGNLTNLADKKVAIIGTGATGVQCIPHLAAWAKHLYVLLRTPSAVDVRANRPTDPEWAANLQPGWQRHRIRNFEAHILGQSQEEDLVADAWTASSAKLRVAVKGSAAPGTSTVARDEMMQIADFEKMNEIRGRVAAIVKDKATAEMLKPYYNLWCKRPCFHDEYLQAFNRENVTVIDTGGKGVEAVYEHGIVANGVEYPLDCLIYSTGFDVAAPAFESGSLSIVGRNGLSLAEKWRDGVRSLHGIYMHGFPNLFIVGGLRQATVGINLPFVLEGQSTHIAEIIAKCAGERIGAFEVSREAEDRWQRTLKEKSAFRTKFAAECTPSYTNNEGKDIDQAVHATVYGGGPIEYFEVVERWRKEDLSKDCVLTDRR